MANTSLNLMDSIENPNGRVAIRLQRNLFSKDSSDKFYGRAIRNTHTVGNVLQLVANKVPQLDIGTVYSVCDALEKVVTESLGNGNRSFPDVFSVRFVVTPYQSVSSSFIE